MNRQAWFLAGIAGILIASSVAAKKKEKVLPEIVLKAQTVLVVILPDAAEPISDSRANLGAKEEVEKALMKWGRFRLALDPDTADLVMAVKRGTDRAVTPTVGGGPIDQPPVTVEQTEGTIRIGGAQGRAPGSGSQSGDPEQTNGRVRTGTESGSPEDLLRVYLGGSEYSVNNAPVWSYAGKDGLRPPTVKAVEEFRKAIEESEKALAQKKQGQQSGNKKSP